jgi:glycosyltransferase involved in cell wall biosynthesis
MRVAVLADYLVNYGGIERLVLITAEAFDADIITGIYLPDKTFPGFRNKKIVQLLENTKQSPFTTLLLWHKYRRIKLDYEAYIFYGAASLNAAWRNKPNLWYCNSPSRYLYDLYEEELKNKRGLNRFIFPIIAGIMRKYDQGNVMNVDAIFVNSRNVQDRVKKYYKRSTIIDYPPDALRSRFIVSGEYFASTCRLDPIKRVDLIVQAFRKMPEIKLKISGDGPDSDKIKEMARGYDNIEVMGRVSEQELKGIYGRCRATIYLSKKEDFGLVPVESMTAGKPCIATNDGGFRETIIHKKTGYLVDNPENVEDVIEAVRWMTMDRAKKMREACEERAKLFTQEKFIDGIKKALEALENG